MKRLLLPLLLGFCIPLFAQPVITQNPVGGIVCPDTCITLDVTAVGNGLSYTWFETVNGVPAEVGMDSAALVICANDYTADSIEVFCIVTDSSGQTDQSNTVVIEFNVCEPPIANFGFTAFGDSICFTDSSERADNVVWNFGDGEQSTERNPCNDYNVTQVFLVRLYAFNAYGSDEIEKEVNVVSVPELRQLEASVYPNPMLDMLYLNSKERMEMVELYDLSGRAILQRPVNGYSVALDVEGLREGSYILRISGQDGVLTRQLMKQ